MKAHNGFRLAALAVLVLIANITYAQTGYKKPPKEIIKLCGVQQRNLQRREIIPVESACQPTCFIFAQLIDETSARS